MQVVDLFPPANGGTLFAGNAVSTRGRQYSFCATFRGEACAVFREVATPDGCRWWRQITPPAALAEVVRRAVHKAVQ